MTSLATENYELFLAHIPAVGVCLLVLAEYRYGRNVFLHEASVRPAVVFVD